MSEKLYGVDVDWSTSQPCIVETPIIKETDLTITLADRLSAYNYKTRLSKRFDKIYRTPQEAADAYITKWQSLLMQAAKDVEKYERALAKAQALKASLEAQP